MRANAAVLAEKLKPFGWEYVVVDIQWYAHKAGTMRETYQYIPFGGSRRRSAAAPGRTGWEPAAKAASRPPRRTCLYCRFSDDGVDWGDPSYWGKRIETADGMYLGNMPHQHGDPLPGPFPQTVVHQEIPGVPQTQLPAVPLAGNDGGWNSYDYYNTAVTEEQVRANAAVLAELEPRAARAAGEPLRVRQQPGVPVHLHPAEGNILVLLLQISYGIGNLETL